MLGFVFKLVLCPVPSANVALQEKGLLDENGKKIPTPGRSHDSLDPAGEEAVLGI